MAKIKILSGWSNPGGSTEAFINLCNLFNQRGHDCTFYGPHEFHLDKCKSGMLGDCPVNEFDERLIVHYLKLPQRPEESEAVILACHEKEIFPVKDIPCFWDNTVFVSESQREWHGTNGVIIPNVVADLEEPKAFILGQPAGIIGSIDENKQTHVSIQRALDDGNKLVKLFGVVTDHGYYDEYVKPYVEDGKAELMGHEDDKQKSNLTKQLEELGYID